MSWLCDLALAAGLTFSGACQPSAPTPDPLPPDDPGAWSYKEPPPPAPPAPPPIPAMPPVVIKQEIIREVPVPAPAPPPPPPPAPKEPQPDPFADAVQATYRQRSTNLGAWPEVAIPASLPGAGSSGLSLATGPRPPAMPLDLGAVINSAGDAEYQEKAITSSLPVDNSRILTTDRIISGIAENGTNTQLDGSAGGSIVIQVDRDVFGYHGRNILIPKGSRLVCGYKSLDKFGATRAPWRCGRLLAGGSRFEIFGMKSNVFDSQGHLGAPGEVDNRFFERYGTAFILAGISAAVRGATAGFGSRTSSSSASAYGSSATYSDGGVLAEGGTELSQRLGEITAATLEQTINLNPILKTFQGQRVQIRPDTDWYIAKVE